MPAAQFWRLVGIETHGAGDLELSSIALLNGLTRVDASAVLSSTSLPIAGVLSNLQDASQETVVRFARVDYCQPAFEIRWDFGTALAVTGLAFQSVGQPFFVRQYAFQYWEGGSWINLTHAISTLYQGDGVLQNVISQDPLFATVQSLYFLNDASKRNVAPSGGVDIVAPGGFTVADGLDCLLAYGGQSYMTVPALTGDFCLEFNWHGLNNAGRNLFELPGSAYKIRVYEANPGYSATIGIANGSNTALAVSSARDGVQNPGQARMA